MLIKAQQTTIDALNQLRMVQLDYVNISKCNSKINHSRKNSDLWSPRHIHSAAQLYQIKSLNINRELSMMSK